MAGSKTPGGFLDVELDERQLASVQRLLADIPRGLPKAVTRGINETLKTSWTRIARTLAKKTRLTQKLIKAGMRMTRAKYTRWWGRIAIFGRRLPLINLKARQTKKGVTYMDPMAGVRKLRKSAFIAIMPAGRSGVFVRLRRDRLPIKELSAPSISEIYRAAPEVSQRIQNESLVLLSRNIDRNARLLIEGIRK